MDHAASDEQIGHAGGMTDIDDAASERAGAPIVTIVATTVRIDTCDRALDAVGHALERRDDPAGGVRWRLTLGRAAPCPVPGGDDAIELVGPADGSVPRVLVSLLAGVTGGQPLVPIVPADATDTRDESDPPARRAGRSPRRRHGLHDGAHVEVPADATIDQTVRAMAVRAVRTLVGLDPHLRLDALPDDVHDARIAVRRIRSELHAMEQLLRPGRTERLRTELIWFGEVLGAVRDLDVVLDHLLPGSAGDAGDDGVRLVRIRVRNQRRVAALVLRNALASQRTRRLYDELRELAVEPWFAKGVDPHRKVRRAALEAVRVADRRLAGAVRSIGDPPDAERLLEVRRRAKACRHVCELVAEPLDSGRLAGAVLELQTTLGALQDSVTIDAWLAGPHRPLLEPAATEAVDALAARADDQRESALSGWPSAWVRAQADALRPWTV